jgi:hypothetical protein
MNKSLKDISMVELKNIAKFYNVTTSETKKELSDTITRLRKLHFKI